MKTKVNLQIIKIDVEGYHLGITCLLNNKKANVIVDTGASRTVFDSNRIHLFTDASRQVAVESQSTGLGTNTMQSALITIDSFKIGKINLKNFDIVLLDMTHVNESYQKIGLQPIDGVIGCDILFKFKASINLKKQCITFRQKEK